jgi:hypothetical protein
MSPAAGVEGDNVAPDYPRGSKVVPARAHRVQCLPVYGKARGRSTAAWRRCACLNVVMARREGTGRRFGHAVTVVDTGAAGVVGGKKDKRSAGFRPLTP